MRTKEEWEQLIAEKKAFKTLRLEVQVTGIYEDGEELVVSFSRQPFEQGMSFRRLTENLADVLGSAATVLVNMKGTSFITLGFVEKSHAVTRFFTLEEKIDPHKQEDSSDNPSED